ncbi:hypothetical protein CDIK_1399 [Cucumispora dikerogammari]|nr:hypothetical protein CDIK_1399 [Cucumispora dikerogammari]
MDRKPTKPSNNKRDSFLKENKDYVSVKNEQYSSGNLNKSDSESYYSTLSSSSTNDTPKIAKQTTPSQTIIIKQHSTIENEDFEKISEVEDLRVKTNKDQIIKSPKYLSPQQTGRRPPTHNQKKMNDLVSKSPSIIWDFLPFLMFLTFVGTVGYLSYGINKNKLKNMSFYWNAFINNVHIFSASVAIGVYFFSMITTSTRFFFLITVLSLNGIVSYQVVDFIIGKTSLSKTVLLLIANLGFGIFSIFIFHYPYNHLITISFQQNITSIYFRTLVSRIFIPILCLYSLLSGILIAGTLFFSKDVSGFIRFLQILILCLFVNFLHTVVLGFDVVILAKKSKFVLIKLLPTLFIYSLLRPTYLILGVLRTKKINEEKTSFANSFKNITNKITKPFQFLMRRFSSTNLYFATVFSVNHGVPSGYAIKTTFQFIETDLYITNIRDVPFFRIFIPICYTAVYVLTKLLPKDHLLPAYPIPVLFLPLLLPDIVIAPFYYAVMKAYQEIKKETLVELRRKRTVNYV